MAARFTSVDEFVSSFSEDVQLMLEQIRQVILAIAPTAVESISYQIIKASVDGDALIFVGAWKHHIGLYPIPAFDGELEAEVAPYRAARDTVQFRYRDPIPYDLIERLVTASLMRHQGQSLAETTPKNGGAGQVNPASDST